ncbi:hypothetical protein PVAP13_4KG204403 [Panicum virgatum]|uniref:Uncharacterized protein n=1 Tax=Panicum virgatum TaxID=38727 RepID=A0A8T0TRW7_PANVG|nr:hypothetical protein PVAP13_4KG204403 [Panicum virgatum]
MLRGGARTSPPQPPRRTHLLSASRQLPPRRTHILSGSLPPPRCTHILSRVPAAAAAPHANLSRAPAAAARISLPASTPLVACKAAGLDAARLPRSGCGKVPGQKVPAGRDPEAAARRPATLRVLLCLLLHHWTQH